MVVGGWWVDRWLVRLWLGEEGLANKSTGDTGVLSIVLVLGNDRAGPRPINH
jgi:hypothetical protein